MFERTQQTENHFSSRERRLAMYLHSLFSKAKAWKASDSEDRKDWLRIARHALLFVDDELGKLREEVRK